MKKYSAIILSIVSGFVVATTQAQPGQAGPDFDGAMAKLFGDNKAFSAMMEIHVPQGGSEMVMPGKLAFLDGNARFDMDLTQMKGGRMNPAVAAQMKQMGMGSITSISGPDKKSTCVIYPDMKAYVEIPKRGSSKTTAKDFKAETTKLGEEKVEGHDCVKNKMVITGPDGTPHESTVWNAHDLKNFPVKIQSSERGSTVEMVFKNVKLEKPDTAQFEPPSGFKKYDDMTSLMMSRVPKGSQQ